MWLRSCLAVAVVLAGSCSSNSTSGLGTSICPRCGPKKQKKKSQPPPQTIWACSRYDSYNSTARKRPEEEAENSQTRPLVVGHDHGVACYHLCRLPVEKFKIPGKSDAIISVPRLSVSPSVSSVGLFLSPCLCLSSALEWFQPV